MLRHITWFISTSALITSPCPSPFPWLAVFQHGWLICSQTPPPSACAFIFLTRVVLSNILTLKSAGLCTTLGSSNIHLPSLLSAAGRCWKPLYSLCHFFEPNAFSYCQMHANLTCPTPQNPEVIFPPDLPQHTGSHVKLWLKESYWNGWLCLILYVKYFSYRLSLAFLLFPEIISFLLF